MKTCLTLIVILLSINYGNSQTKETYDKSFGNFVIHVTDEATERFAEMQNLRADSIWTKSKPKFDLTDLAVPKPPPVAVYKKEYKIYFFVKPNMYTQYTINHNSWREVANILKVNRETLIGTNFSPYSFELKENSWDFNRRSEDAFEIIEISKNDKKTICDFECYKVVLRTNGMLKRTVEMYVTEQIELNYNPAFPNPHLLKKFYPLYVKEYLENYPNDVYKEFVFELE